MKVSNNQYASLVLGSFILTIVIAMIFTPWQTSEIEKLNTEQGFDTESIRGWMTIQEVSDASGISIEEFYRISGIPTTIPSETPLKEIKNTVEGYEVDTIRIAIDNYQPVQQEQEYLCPYGIPYDPAPGLCGFYTDKNFDQECDYQLA